MSARIGVRTFVDEHCRAERCTRNPRFPPPPPTAPSSGGLVGEGAATLRLARRLTRPLEAGGNGRVGSLRALLWRPRGVVGGEGMPGGGVRVGSAALAGGRERVGVAILSRTATLLEPTVPLVRWLPTPIIPGIAADHYRHLRRDPRPPETECCLNLGRSSSMPRFPEAGNATSSTGTFHVFDG